ncbi:MAG: fructose-bisphosphate aldolase class I [Deltaproteobacteria bacterium]|nr:MAG: fructose-bisphosphate aldolase class I [Deltaproteobacteria bacterium]
MTTLNDIARALVAPGKGILAADESFPTIAKRFASVGVESTEQTRRTYRTMMFSTAGIAEYISGVILFDETLRQEMPDGCPIPKALSAAGILPGIKVDKGAKPLAGFPGEKVTEGLDGLRDRLKEYSDLGAKFAKWRAVIAIGSGLPTAFCIEANAHALARYAALCQEAGLVPIVEPEVLMDGDHDIDRCDEVTRATLHEVFGALFRHRVDLEGMLLKPNMVLPGKDCPKKASVQEVAERTVAALRACVPAAVPGIVFLSGGQSDEEATAHLDAMNRLGPHPWELSFSYGRALQQPALKTWAGDDTRIEAAQRAFHHRARMNSAARYGRYDVSMERDAPAVG